MSGIGLPLERTITRGTYARGATSYLTAVVITSGPWLSAVLSLAILDGVMAVHLLPSERALLFMTITFAVITSLLVTSGPAAIVNRYLSDRLYVKDTAAVIPACAGVLLGVAPMAVLVSPFLLLQSLDWRYRWLSITLFLTFALTWLMMAFVSASRDRLRTALMIMASYALSLLAGVAFGRLYGFLGTLAGFTLGQVSCLGLLVSNVYLAFPVSSGISFEFLGYVRKHRALFFIGLLTTASIWVDNAVFWFEPHAVTVAGIFRTFPPYDIAKLVGYLLTIPASAAFFMRVESDFAPAILGYSRRIEQGGTYREINQAKQHVVQAVRSAILIVLKVQGLVALAALLFTPALASFLRMPAIWIPLLRIMILAGSVNFLVMVGLLFLSYLDDRKASLTVLVVFIGCNLCLTEITVWLGPAFYGWGYLVSTIIAAALAMYWVRKHLLQMDYVTFMLQPVA